MSAVTWLHLSDWHQKGPDFDRKVVRDALIADVRGRATIDPRLGQVDFVVFSGDATFSGQPIEFETAKTQLFDPILRAVGLTADKLFFVPGNHDLDRGTVIEMLPPALQHPLQTDADVQHWQTDERRLTRLLEPFEAYENFVSKYAAQERPAYASIKKLVIDGKSVALLGLNSAWMSARVTDTGEFNDYGSLLVGEPQIHDALDKIAGDDLRVIVVHHPFNWLAEFDRSRTQRRLEGSAHFILCGHQHAPGVSVVKGTNGECVVVPAGASYNRRKPEDPRYTNSYNFVRVEFETGHGMIYLRHWSDPSNAWIKDSDTCAGGRYEFSLPSNLAGSGAGSTPGLAPVTTGLRSHAERMEAAAHYYRDLLLESCDIIDLANLPEQDRDLAHRQLELRRLYVPLRVRVEARGEEPAADTIWDALEKRRTAAWRGNPARKETAKRERVSVGQRLAETRRVVLLGDPGAGKTTLTRWIATAYLLRLKSDPGWKDLPDVQTLPDTDWMPILVRCRDLDAACLEGALDDILRHTLRKAEMDAQGAAEVHELLREKIGAGQALLVLDGLDEIADPSGRARFCTQIETIVTAHPQLAIIATSRIVGYREMGRRLGRGFEHLTLADLWPEEKDEFARRWCHLTERPERQASAAAELIADVHSSDRIERLTGNPLLLTTMALVKRKLGKLPQRRADLYWEALQVLLNWRTEVDRPIDHREAVPQLEYLAYAMCDRGVQLLREEEVLELFRQMRQDFPNVYAVHDRTPETFLRVLEARTGILNQAGYTRHHGSMVPVYEFRHLTFQEYLAARALVDRRFPGRDINRKLADDVGPLAGRTSSAPSDSISDETTVVEAWREALRLATSICADDDVDAVIRAIMRPQEGESSATSRARVIQATLCLADEPNVSETVGAEIVQALVAQVGPQEGRGVGETTLYRAAIELAGTRWGPGFSTALLTEFYQQNSDSRPKYGVLLGRIDAGPPPTDDKKLSIWLKESVLRLRDEDERIAVRTALALMIVAYQRRGLVVPPGLVEALLDRLAGSTPMAHAAAWALGWFNDEHLGKGRWRPTEAQVDTLMARIENPKTDSEIVFWLAGILGNEKNEAVIQTLKFWLASTSARLRWRVAQALGRIGSDQATDTLIATLCDDDSDVRSAAAEALGRIGSDRATDTLIATLRDDDSDVRSAAAEALGQIGGERATDALIARLGDDDSDVRRAAIGAIAQRLEKANRALLSRDLDGLSPFLDPREPIGARRFEEAASRLKLTLDDVGARYKELARRFGLRLSE